MKNNNNNVYECTIDGVTTRVRPLNINEEIKAGKDHLPMVAVEVITDDPNKARIGYLMPFRGYAFSIQSSCSKDGGGQCACSACSPKLAEIAKIDEYGDIALKPIIIEVINRFGGRTDAWFGGHEVIERFIAESIVFLLNRIGEPAPKWTNKYVESKKPDLSGITPEEMMKLVIEGKLKISF